MSEVALIVDADYEREFHQLFADGLLEQLPKISDGTLFRLTDAGRTVAEAG